MLGESDCSKLRDLIFASTFQTAQPGVSERLFRFVAVEPGGVGNSDATVHYAYAPAVWDRAGYSSMPNDVVTLLEVTIDESPYKDKNLALQFHDYLRGWPIPWGITAKESFNNFPSLVLLEAAPRSGVAAVKGKRTMNKKERDRLIRIRDALQAVPGAHTGHGTRTASVAGFIAFHRDIVDGDYPIFINKDGCVFVRIYPGTDIFVETARQTALHIFSLARRYSDTIRRKSWASFWPRIDQIERSITALFMEANNALGTGMLSFDMIHPDVLQSGLADDFRDVSSRNRRKTLTKDVEKELVELYRVHVKAKVPVGMVRTIWKQEWPKVAALLQTHHALEPLLENDRCYDTHYVYEVVQNLLLQHGHPVIQGAGEDDAVMSHEAWCDNDARIFASAIYRHADDR